MKENETPVTEAIKLSVVEGTIADDVRVSCR